MALQPGTPAPDFSLVTKTDSGLETVSLSDFKGKKNVVLLFFPAAFTGVCTDELCGVTNSFGQFDNAGAVVYGISGDTPFAQEAWAKEHDITVPLLSDYSKTATKAYDVVLPDLVGLGPASQRASFVINRDGVIVHSEVTATPADLPDFDAIHAALANL